MDGRTDIHALGVVFYELLTGRKAFMGDTLEQITNAVLNNHPAPAHELRPGVSRTLSDIASKAMARKPDERFATAAEMSQELRRWVERHTENEPVNPATLATPMTPVSTPAVAGAPTARTPSPRWLAGLAALGVGAVALALLQRTPEEASAPSAAAPAAAAPAVLLAAPPPAAEPTPAEPTAESSATPHPARTRAGQGGHRPADAPARHLPQRPSPAKPAPPRQCRHRPQ